MFQTHLNHFFQSLESGFFTWLMKAISVFGVEYVIIPLLIILMFGLDFRKGFIMIQVSAWAALLIGLLKNLFALPRPFDVDASLKHFGAEYTLQENRFNTYGSGHFWGVLPRDMVHVLRESGMSDYGMPSGHVTLSTSFFGTLSLLYRKTWVWIISFFFILSMPVSRIYLSRHFLADTLGGLALGGMIVFLAWSLIARTPRFIGFTKAAVLNVFSLKGNRSWPVMLFLLPLLLLIIPETPRSPLGQLLGFNLAFALLVRSGVPLHSGRIIHAFLRAVLMLVLVFTMIFAAHFLQEAAGYAEESLIGFGVSFLSMFLPVFLGTRLCLKLGWYRQWE